MSSTVDDGPVRIAFTGRLDASTVRGYEREIIWALQKGRGITLDFSGANEITSVGMRILLVLFRTLSCQGTDVTVEGVTPALIDTLDAVGFLHLSRACLIGPVEPAKSIEALLLHRVDTYPSHFI